MRIEKDVPMEMRDGIVLRADVYRPDDNEKHPAILFRSGYNKAQSVPRRDFMSLVDMILAGYAIVIQDIRGRFASDGEWGGGYSVEFKDGYDSVEVFRELDEDSITVIDHYEKEGSQEIRNGSGQSNEKKVLVVAFELIRISLLDDKAGRVIPLY